jgi:hypothetical protein
LVVVVRLAATQLVGREGEMVNVREKAEAAEAKKEILDEPCR